MLNIHIAVLNTMACS